MIIIGIVTDLKSESNIKKLLLVNKFLSDKSVIFIKEKNIDNIRNVHFDTIVINRGFEKIDELNKVLENTKNVIINVDMNLADKNICVENSNLITYGFNSKSSITISSVTDDEVLIYVQRNIYNNYREIEVQEIKIENNPNYSIYDLIIVLTMFLLYTPSINKININGIK